jgi:hypothetical protein
VQAPEAGPGAEFTGATEDVPLGRLCGARSGDKGGDANVGLWATSPRAYAWLRRYLTIDRFRPDQRVRKRTSAIGADILVHCDSDKLM